MSKPLPQPADALSARSRGFTFVELLIAITLMGFIAIPALWLFRLGSRQSGQGMMRLQATLEARQILQRIRLDLESAVFPTRGWNIDVLPEEQLLDIRKPLPWPEYCLLCFSRNTEIATAGTALPKDAASRGISRVTWVLEAPSQRPGAGKLIRIEEPHPTTGGVTRKTVISQRVNAFAIRREGIDYTDPRTGHINTVSLYRITLQLIDRLPPGLANSTSKDGKPFQSPEILISDYMETAIPEFLHGKRLEPFGSQNWHTGITGFSDRLSPPW